MHPVDSPASHHARLIATEAVSAAWASALGGASESAVRHEEAGPRRSALAGGLRH
jgi:hypothetical protein